MRRAPLSGHDAPPCRGWPGRRCRPESASGRLCAAGAAGCSGDARQGETTVGAIPSSARTRISSKVPNPKYKLCSQEYPMMASSVKFQMSIAKPATADASRAQ